MPTQLIMQSLSKAIIQNITFLLLSSDFYVSIKDKTDISARTISKKSIRGTVLKLLCLLEIIQPSFQMPILSIPEDYSI